MFCPRCRNQLKCQGLEIGDRLYFQLVCPIHGVIERKEGGKISPVDDRWHGECPFCGHSAKSHHSALVH